MLAWDKSASLGEEAVLADSGRAGKVVAGVGRVRMLRAVKGNLSLSPKIKKLPEVHSDHMPAVAAGLHSQPGFRS